MKISRSIARRISTVAASTAITMSLLASGSAHAISPSFNGPRDCDANAVMYCGAMSASELQTKYKQNASIGAIYNYFGISAADVSQLGSTAVAGYVTKSGTVTVNGKVVANNAVTVGRHYIAGSTQISTGGVNFFTRAPHVSFVSDQISAFVVLNSHGQFRFAILTACGNAVKATNTVPTPKTPVKPTPKPTTPKPTTPTPTTPTPETPTTPETPVTPTAELVKTGPATNIALFVIASVAGTIAYRVYLNRRTN